MKKTFFLLLLSVCISLYSCEKAENNDNSTTDTNVYVDFNKGSLISGVEISLVAAGGITLHTETVYSSQKINFGTLNTGSYAVQGVGEKDVSPVQGYTDIRTVYADKGFQVQAGQGKVITLNSYDFSY